MLQINIGRRSRACLLVLLGASLALSGCASIPGGKPDPRDHFERMNRATYKFNTGVDHAVLRPVAREYVKVIPNGVRIHISDFLSNLTYPNTLINDFLQGKPNDGAQDLARLVVNTTLGIGGLFDPASRMGIERHNEDFGLTLGHYGVKPGPYLMLPFLGPSDIRDTAGMGVDYYALYEIVSVNLLQNDYADYGISAVRIIDTRASLLDTDQILAGTFDPYAFVRNAYLQRREFLLHPDAPVDRDFPPPDDSADDSGTDSSSTGAANPPAPK